VRRAVTSLLALVVVLAGVPAGASTGKCAAERRAVKTGTDSEAGLVDRSQSSPTSVGELSSLPAPSSAPRDGDGRVRPVETTVYSLTATLTDYVLEADSDYHLVLADAKGRTLIVEIPDPACVGPGSPFAPSIAQGRKDVDGRFSVTERSKKANIPVRVTGVGFWDDIHGERSVAPNGIELHPVLSVTFNPPADPSASTRAAANPASSAAGCQKTLPAGTVKGAAASPSGFGYLLATIRGAVAAFGRQPCLGSVDGTALSAPVVSATASKSGGGYWLLGADGGVFSFGDAPFLGSAGDLVLGKPVVAMSATPDGAGYRLVTSDGRIITFGSAQSFGTMAGKRLNRLITAMATTSSGAGYWLAGGDGGIFSFGDAGYFGSPASRRLNGSIVGLAPTPSGKGYWLAGSDGGVFNFGDAGFFGSAANVPLNGPITAMAATPTGKGYWLFGSDGGVFSFGDAGYFGSAVAPAAAAAAAAPDSSTCSATVDNPNPSRYGKVHVLVTSGLPSTPVTAVAHFKWLDSTSRGTTTSSGTADLRLIYSGATAGYTVRVDVNVGGRQTCTTQFTPRE
jgi:hypothetical protein